MHIFCTCIFSEVIFSVYAYIFSVYAYFLYMHIFWSNIFCVRYCVISGILISWKIIANDILYFYFYIILILILRNFYISYYVIIIIIPFLIRFCLHILYIIYVLCVLATLMLLRHLLNSKSLPTFKKCTDGYLQCMQFNLRVSYKDVFVYLWKIKYCIVSPD